MIRGSKGISVQGSGGQSCEWERGQSGSQSVRGSGIKKPTTFLFSYRCSCDNLDRGRIFVSKVKCPLEISIFLVLGFWKVEVCGTQPSCQHVFSHSLVFQTEFPSVPPLCISCYDQAHPTVHCLTFNSAASGQGWRDSRGIRSPFF